MTGSKNDDKLERSDSEEIIRNLRLGWFSRMRMKMMSREEREAFLIQKVDEEKKRRQKRTTRQPGK